MQSAVSSQDRCTIPDCDDLASGDETRMVGFKPLSSNTGSGAQNNTFTITPVNKAVKVTGAVYGTVVVAVLTWACTLLL